MEKKQEPEKLATVQTPGREPTIDELEAMMGEDGEQLIEILPNGTVREREEPIQGRKPITMRKDLGGEYARKGQ